MTHALLVVGFIFPVLSWLTLIAGFVQSRKSGNFYSGIYVPFFGPLLIDLWILAVGAPKWTLIIPWVGDIGTLLFLWVLPRLVLDEWRTSRFTRTFLFAGTSGNQAVTISFHKGGYYVMRKTWQRPAGECGITALGEPGRFEGNADCITLTSDTGTTRQLTKAGNEFLVADSDSSEDYSIDQWTLRKQSA